jgi:lysozyme family protein
MVDRVAPFPFPTVSTCENCGGSASSREQTINFLKLLTRSLEKPNTVQTVSSPSLNPIALSPYAPTVETNLAAEESPMKEVIDFVLSQEGSTYVSRDGGRESSKYGVLQSTARGYGFQGSIKNLTRAEATKIYEKMWRESGAEKLPRDLAMVHFDTYINSPAAARKMLKVCEGDTDKYLELRAERYSRLAERRPERFAKYMKGWMNRIEHLRTMVAQSNNTSSIEAST